MTTQKSAPLNAPDMETINLGTGGFGYSTVSIDTFNNIGTQFCLVTALMDVSPSTFDFIGDMERTLVDVAKACKLAPEIDTFAFRVMRFARDFDEIHGFMPLAQVDEDQYIGKLSNHNLGGSTSLNDACINSMDASRSESERLNKQDIDVNAVMFVITDGLNNSSRHNMSDVQKAFKKLTAQESCLSFLPILVGVNVGQPGDGDYEKEAIRQGLEQFQKEAGFAQYIPLPDASPKTLAKLGKFITKSMSSSSQALQNRQPSKPIDINAI